jgi:hypothetical protein
MSRGFTDSVLMMRPRHFGFNPETAESNAFQDATFQITGDSNAQALIEFEQAVRILRANEIVVVVCEDTEIPAKPDAIFPNNWFSTHSTGEVFLYPMLTLNRRSEVRQDVIDKIKAAFNYTKIIDLRGHYKSICEGTGSIVFDHDAKIAYAAKSSRTDPEFVGDVAQRLGYSPIIFEAVDENYSDIYHTNVVMFVGPDFVLLCKACLRNGKEELIETISKSGKKIIEINYSQMNQFAGNGICLKNKKGEFLTVLSTTALQSLDDSQIKAIGNQTKIVEIDVSFIEKVGGGGIRCMIAELF